MGCKCTGETVRTRERQRHFSKRFQKRRLFPHLDICVSYVEIVSILLHEFNCAAIDIVAFYAAESALRTELINDPAFILLSVDDTVCDAWIALMEPYNLSVAEAIMNRKDVEQLNQLLARMQEADPDFSVFGTHYHKYRFGPTLSEEQLQAFEKQHQIRLPDDYRFFLKEVGMDQQSVPQPV